MNVCLSTEYFSLRNSVTFIVTVPLKKGHKINKLVIDGRGAE